MTRTHSRHTYTRTQSYTHTYTHTLLLSQVVRTPNAQQPMNLTATRIAQLSVAVICVIAGLSWAIEVMEDGWLRWVLSALVLGLTASACGVCLWFLGFVILMCTHNHN